MREFEYVAPKTVKEALSLLATYKEKATILAGGTDVVVRLRDEIIDPEFIIDIKHIDELNGIKFDKKEGLFVGANATMHEIQNDKNVKEFYPFYAEACGHVGSKQVRNKATSVGNLCTASPLGDSLTPMYCLDATVVIEGPKGKREVPVREFITFVRKTVLERDELVLGVKFPYVECKGIYTKNARRHEVDLSNIVATILKIGDEYRIAYGSVAPTPIRLVKTEEFLKGKKIDDKVIEEAKKILATEISPISDLRATKEYRVSVSQSILENSLKALG
ncbi:MAG: xanthine dehydrogenase family protein subunit M [Lachnospiraceae bacterium]|nr:xanthine dehydrogenase family protein subunit M [Lachnospiraceae bacterium]MBR4313430.1 xanthine dehydrogenase family protein subunit M [Lachnospiraceae bacterium]